MNDAMPAELRDTMARAKRLEWWTIGLMLTVIAVMGAAMGQSQAMKTAWIEDCLSLLAPAVFLISARVERMPPSSRFPNGFARAPGLAFAIAATALTALGGVLLIESALTLIAREHATVPMVTIMGREVWLGWMMVAAQVYSIIVPFVLGRLKLPLARALNDKTLHTDAQTQKADWMTGAAGIGGVVGIGFGLWWADAVAAGLISFGILHDGIRALRSASAELVDGAPRALDSDDVADDARALHAALSERFPGAEVHLRELGRVIAVQVVGATPPDTTLDPGDYWPGDPERRWRLGHVSFVPPLPEGAERLGKAAP